MLPSFDEDFEFLDSVCSQALDEEVISNLDCLLNEDFEYQFITDDVSPCVPMEFNIESMNGSMRGFSCVENGQIRQTCSRSPSPSRKRRSHVDEAVTQSDDVSMCSYVTSQCSGAPSTAPARPGYRVPSPNSSSSSSETSCFSSSPIMQVKYNEALEKLALSMRRTEESRAQIMSQRDLATLRKQSKNARPTTNTSRITSAAPLIPSSTCSSSIVVGFFSGSRTTLTSGLEQSQRQLRTYMDQIKCQDW